MIDPEFFRGANSTNVTTDRGDSPRRRRRNLSPQTRGAGGALISPSPLSFSSRQPPVPRSVGVPCVGLGLVGFISSSQNWETCPNLW